MNQIASFKPVIDRNTNILILGTILGVKSLESECYYGNSKNHFWDIIYRILEADYDFYQLVGSTPKADKYQVLAYGTSLKPAKEKAVVIRKLKMKS